MKNFLLAAAALLLASGWCLAQQNTINSPSFSPNQNQLLTGQSGHQVPPAPLFYGGVPETGDRVSGTPANANPMRQGIVKPPPEELTSPGDAVFLPAAGQKPPASAMKGNKSSKSRP
jgi:hypothetical protein